MRWGLLILLMSGCSGIQSKPTQEAVEETRGDLGPLPPPPVAETALPAPEPRMAMAVPEKVDSGPIYYERIVYRERPAVPVPIATPAMGVCATCPGCPDCKPIVNINPPAAEKEGPWGFIAAALGGAASVLAAAFAKKFLGVSA